MPAVSEVFAVPGNANLSPAEREARTQAIYRPFVASLSQTIAARQKAGQPTVLVTMHSFTPVYFGKPRSVEVGILHDADARLADAMLASALRQGAQGAATFDIRRNEPYGPADGVTHTLIEQGLKNGLLNVMIEIRNDLVSNEAGQRVMADYLVALLGESLASLPQ